MKQRMWITMMTMGLAVPAAAQTSSRTTAPPDEVKQEIERMASVEEKRQVISRMVGEIRSRTAVEARITPGRPYSAEAVTESTQMLADGNRIARKSVTRVYRDSEGRTRREQINDSGVVESVSIVDPVAGTSAVLQPDTRTAYRDGGGAVILRKVREAEAAELKRSLETYEIAERTGAERAQVDLEKRREHDMFLVQSAHAGGRGSGGMTRAAAGETVREELGTQTVEGVPATGTRTTTTIPAGAIGNLQPIKVVAEQWFSPDLQVLVLTKHSDPRSGETTYRLVNVVRAEPDRSLFTVPPDYTIKGSGIHDPASR
jgi:hypothetical protein